MTTSGSSKDGSPLSLRAIGLLEVYRSAKRVIPTNELRPSVKEGRDAILAAKRELRNAGFIKTEKSQVAGKWSTNDRLCDPNALRIVADSG
jgi:hypothetical protein